MEGAAGAHLGWGEVRAVGEVEGGRGVWLGAFFGLEAGLCWVDSGVVGWKGNGFGVLGCFCCC